MCLGNKVIKSKGTKKKVFESSLHCYFFSLITIQTEKKNCNGNLRKDKYGKHEIVKDTPELVSTNKKNQRLFLTLVWSC